MSHPENEVIAQRTQSETHLHAKGITSIEIGRARQRRREHVALLVSDQDLHVARIALRDYKFAKPHLFTPSGADGASFRLDHPDYKKLTLAVFPIRLATGLLAVAAGQNGPDVTDRFRIAAYVTVYFGSASRLMGLNSNAADFDELTKLAQQSKIAVSDTSNRKALDNLMFECNWRPSDDMLERLSLADPWIRDVLLPHPSDADKMAVGLSVFFCRARAVEKQFLAPMCDSIEETGFEILHTHPLSGEIAKQVERTTRGGNWGAGPYPVSGGPPAHLIVAVDVFPQASSPKTLRKHPFLDNQRTLTAKQAARDVIFRPIPATEHFPPMHSTDTSAEAQFVLRHLLSDAEADGLMSQFATQRQEIVKLSKDAVFLPGNNRISAMIRIETTSGPRLRKIFRKQYSHHLPASKDIQNKLSQKMPGYLPVLDSGVNFLDMSDPGASFRPLWPKSQKMPLKTLLNLRALLAYAAKQGIHPASFDPRYGVLISQDAQEICLPPFDLPSATDSAQTLSELLPEEVLNSITTPSYHDIWYPALRVPRHVFLSGQVYSILFHSRLVYPAKQAIRTVGKNAKRIASAGRRILKRLKSHLFAR